MPYNRRGQYPTAILYNLPANQLNIPHLKKNGAARRLLRSAFIFAFFSERPMCRSVSVLRFFGTTHRSFPTELQDKKIPFFWALRASPILYCGIFLIYAAGLLFLLV